MADWEASFPVPCVIHDTLRGSRNRLRFSTELRLGRGSLHIGLHNGLPGLRYRLLLSPCSLVREGRSTQGNARGVMGVRHGGTC